MARTTRTARDRRHADGRAERRTERSARRGLSSVVIGWIVFGVVLLAAMPFVLPMLSEQAMGAVMGSLFAAAALLVGVAGIGQLLRGRAGVGAGLVLGAAVLAVLFVMVGLDDLRALLSGPE